jgi:hypothetical protein
VCAVVKFTRWDVHVGPLASAPANYCCSGTYVNFATRSYILDIFHVLHVL